MPESFVADPALALGQAKVYAVCVDHRILILAVRAFRRKPNRITLAQLSPVAGHTHAYDSAQRGVGLIARRGILNATARRTGGIVPTIIAVRITIAALRNLLH